MEGVKSNMRTFVFLVFVLSICSCGLAAESVGWFKDPAHPGKCVLYNLIMSPGEEAKLPQACGRIFCSEGGFATIQTCGVMGASEGCRYGDYINIDAPYSECCEKELIC